MATVDPEILARRLLRSPYILGAVAALVVAVTILGTWRYWNNRFALDVTTGTVSITAAATATHPVELTLPVDAELQVTGFRLAFPSPELDPAGAAVGVMRIKADTLVLRSVALNGGAGLTLATTPEGHLDLSLRDGGSLDLMIGGAVRKFERDGTLTNVVTFQKPLTLQLGSDGSAQPLRLVVVTLAPLPGLTLGDQPVSEIRFSSPRPAGRDQRLPFQSRIIGGTLRLLDTGRELTLRPRELVWLGGMAANVARIEPARDEGGGPKTGFLVEAFGTARTIGVGPPRPGKATADHDLRPSVLEYILNEHDVTVVWGVMVVILGALLRAWLWAHKAPA